MPTQCNQYPESVLTPTRLLYQLPIHNLRQPLHPQISSIPHHTSSKPTLGGEEDKRKAHIPRKKSRLKHPLHQSNRNRIMPTGPHPFSKTRTGAGTLRIALKCRPGGENPLDTQSPQQLS